MQLVVEVFKHFVKRVLLSNTKSVLIERIEPSFLFLFILFIFVKVNRHFYDMVKIYVRFILYVNIFTT